MCDRFEQFVPGDCLRVGNIGEVTEELARGIGNARLVQADAGNERADAIGARPLQCNVGPGIVAVGDHRIQRCPGLNETGDRRRHRGEERIGGEDGSAERPDALVHGQGIGEILSALRPGN